VKKIVSVKTISRAEWLEYRRRGIGGSDAAAVVGLNPYKSELALWADKQGKLPEVEDNESMRTGRDLEDYVARRWCEATGRRVHRNNYMCAHDDYDFILADIDREVVGENAGLECKTTSAYNRADIEDGKVPITYQVQCYHYMNVMGYDRMYLAVLVLGVGFYSFVIERNNGEQNALLRAEVDWWGKHMVQGAEPTADGSDSAGDAIMALHGTCTSEDHVILHDMYTDFERMDEIKTAIKDLEREESEIKQEAQQRMGACAYADAGKYRITWTPQSRTSIDGRRLEKEHPDIYRAYSATTTSRIFKAKIIKGERL